MTSSNRKTTTLVGTILEEEVVLTLDEVCHAARLSSRRVIELTREGKPSRIELIENAVGSD